MITQEIQEHLWDQKCHHSSFHQCSKDSDAPWLALHISGTKLGEIQMQEMCIQDDITLPYGVFKAVVRGSWKNKVSATQLLNVSETLKLRCVDDTNKKGMYFNVPMNWIVKNLQKPNNSVINI